MVLSENLKAKDYLTIEDFIEAAEFCFYHGSDLALRVISAMLTIPIAVWNSHFIWISAPYISVYECPVLVVMDCGGNFHGTGNSHSLPMFHLQISIISISEKCTNKIFPLFSSLGYRYSKTDAFSRQGIL